MARDSSMKNRPTRKILMKAADSHICGLVLMWADTLAKPCDHLRCFRIDLTHLCHLDGLLSIVGLIDTYRVYPKTLR